MEAFSFNPWNQWPQSGVAIQSKLVSVTYAEANLMTATIRRDLEESGVTAESSVEIRLADPISWLVTLALLQIGATSYVSAGAPVSVLPDFIVGDAVYDLTGFAKVIPFSANWLKPTAYPAETQFSQSVFPISDKLVRIIFTSGTSGRPKGVGVTFGDLIKRLTFLKSYWADSDKELNLMGLSATGGFYSALSAFANGRTYYSAYPFGPESVKFLSEQNLELLTGSPIQVSDLISALEAAGLSMSSIKKVRLAGASPTPALLDKIRVTFTNAEIELLYGSTEGGGVAKRIVGPGSSPTNVGQIIAGVSLEIVDESNKPTENQEIGQIRYKTPGLIQGYLNDAEHSKLHFRDGWFYPGDNGYLDDEGSLVLAGRESDLVNLDGIKLNLLDVDQVAGAFPNITDAASFLAENRIGMQILGLSVVGENIQMKELENRLVGTLGIAPKVFIKSRTIPRNANGKVDREALKNTFNRIRDSRN